MTRPDLPPNRLHDAADALRATPAHGSTLHVIVFNQVADWLQETARRLDNPLSSVSRFDLDHAQRIADAVLGTPRDTTQESQQ